MDAVIKKIIYGAIILLFLIGAVIIFIIVNNKQQNTVAGSNGLIRDGNNYSDNGTDSKSETSNGMMNNGRPNDDSRQGSTSETELPVMSGSHSKESDSYKPGSAGQTSAQAEASTQTSSHQPHSHQPQTQPESHQPQTQPEPIFRGITTMQAMTPEICASEPTPSNSITTTTNSHQEGNAVAIPQAVLKDVRDNKNYYVRKLADGNCWMTQNLAFFANETDPTNSDATRTYTIGYGHIKGDGSSTFNLCVYDDTVTSCDNDVESANLNRIGYYYHVATTLSGICPKGWTVPGKENGSKNFGGLIDTYTDNLSIAFNYIRSGEVVRGSITNQGVSGRYWTNYSDGLANRNIYFFYGAGFGQYTEQAHWHSIRCVSK